MLNDDEKMSLESGMLARSGSPSASSEGRLHTWRDARTALEDEEATRRRLGGGGGHHAPSSDKKVPDTIYCAPPREDEEMRQDGGHENLNFRRRLGES